MVAEIRISTDAIGRWGNLVLLLTLLVCSPQTAHAQLDVAVRAFDEGNDHFRDGRYEEAIDAYLTAVENGYASGALYYNLGLAYYRNDQLGQAIRYFEKARVLMPDNRQLLHNLDIARAKTIDQISQLPLPWWIRWWRSHIAKTGGRWFLWAGLLLYLAGMALLAHRLRTRTRSPWFRRLRGGALVLAVVLLVAAFSASVQSERHNRAVVIVSQQPLQAEPAADARTEMTIHEGLVVDVIREQGAWSEIQLPNGTRGWVTRDALGEI